MMRLRVFWLVISIVLEAFVTMGCCPVVVDNRHSSTHGSESLGRRFPVKLRSAGWEVSVAFKDGELGRPLEAFQVLLARKGKEERKIRSVDDLSDLGLEISSAEEAVDFVEFLTDPEHYFLLSPPLGISVHPGKSGATRRIGDVRAEALQEMGISGDVEVASEGGKYLIKRPILVPVPDMEGLRVYQLREQVTSKGDYRLEGAELVGKLSRDAVISGPPVEYGWWKTGTGMADGFKGKGS